MKRNTTKHVGALGTFIHKPIDSQLLFPGKQGTEFV